MMGFQVDAKSFNIEKFLLLKKPDDVKAISTLCISNTINFSSEYLMFIDIEPTDILGVVNKTSYYIPFIRELSLLLIKKSTFLTVGSDEIINHAKIYTFLNIYNNKKLILDFLGIYNQYNKPNIFAHNGCNFDFIIIKGYIYRYLDKLYHSIVKEMIFVDTFIVALKEKLDKSITLSNSNLFRYYINSTDTLLQDTHTAEADVKMLCRWFKCINHCKI